MQFLSHTDPISFLLFFLHWSYFNCLQPCVAGSYHKETCRPRSFPSSQTLLLDSAVLCLQNPLQASAAL